MARALGNLEKTAEHSFHADLAFLIAMHCLEADRGDALAALSITADEFEKRFGPAFRVWITRS